MTSVTEANVENYRTEHECDEHWELRRKFLITHGDKFPIDELLCLAQVFTNVEFLGCKYPQDTMRLISELSKDVVQDYRERQKTRLQRTFVGASDAASSKAKGRSRQESTPKQGGTSQEGLSTLSTSFKRQQDSSAESSYNLPPAKKKRQYKGRGTEIVLFEYPNDTPLSIMTRAASSFYSQHFEFVYDQIPTGTLCTILFNRTEIGKAAALSQKDAKREASIKALEELKKHYYTIKVTKSLTPTVTETFDAAKDSTTMSDAIGSDNIGSKMMKMMGWSGGGLGKKSQGRVEPVSVQQQMTRQGLGLKPGLYNMHLFKKKCTEVLSNYMNGDSSADMVFSPCFSNDERAMIHQVAKQLGLKSQSYGAKDKRTLTISRKIYPPELVNELLDLGGSTEKYELIEPSEG